MESEMHGIGAHFPAIGQDTGLVCGGDILPGIELEYVGSSRPVLIDVSGRHPFKVGLYPDGGRAAVGAKVDIPARGVLVGLIDQDSKRSAHCGSAGCRRSCCCRCGC